jgi:hypothetical protein
MRACLVFCLATGWGMAQEAEVAVHRVQDFAFLTGQWRTEMWGGTGEEMWTAPAGGNMLCVWRFIKNGKLVFTEFVSLEDDARRGAVMRIKHFHPAMKGWEEKNDSVVLFLSRFAPGDAEWSSSENGKRITLRYRTVPGGIESTLVNLQDGKREETTFRFTRF